MKTELIVTCLITAYIQMRNIRFYLDAAEAVAYALNKRKYKSSYWWNFSWFLFMMMLYFDKNI